MTTTDIVNDKIKKGQPFTAWTVTTEGRKQNLRASHDDVRKEVHQLFKGGQMNDYKRESVVIPGRTNKCFLYYPPALSPADPALLDYVFANGPEVSSTSAPAPFVQPIGRTDPACGS